MCTCNVRCDHDDTQCSREGKKEGEIRQEEESVVQEEVAASGDASSSDHEIDGVSVQCDTSKSD